jgi:UDP-glucuronate 4-epimerase
VDDIANGVVAALDHNAQANPAWDGMNPDPATSKVPWRVYNIGNNQPVKLMRYIELLENSLGKKAELNLLPLQPGDVPDTFANVDNLAHDVGYRPATSVEAGVNRFVQWYRDYYQV